MKLVYANQNTQLLAEDGMPWNVGVDSVWSSDHPLVRKYPWAFDEQPRRVNGVPYRPVEQATAAPGERRRVG